MTRKAQNPCVNAPGSTISEKMGYGMGKYSLQGRGKKKYPLTPLNRAGSTNSNLSREECRVCLKMINGKRKDANFCSARHRLLSWAASEIIRLWDSGEVDGLKGLFVRLNPKVDDETVRVAKEFLDGHPEVAKKYIENPKDHRKSVPPGGGIDAGAIIISRFLGKNWKEDRVGRILERLKLYGNGPMERDVEPKSLTFEFAVPKKADK